MNSVKFELPPFSWNKNNYAREILTMKRGNRRRASLGQIVIETLRATRGMPSKDELQKLSRIRRDRFLPVLKYLVDARFVSRAGTGRKGDPFLYRLP